MRRILFCSILISLASAAFLYGQTNNQIDESQFRNLEFRSIGPATMGGRIDRFAVVENKSKIIYAGTASGGVFKTVNNGTTWEPIFDNQTVSSIGDIAVS